MAQEENKISETHRKLLLRGGGNIGPNGEEYDQEGNIISQRDCPEIITRESIKEQWEKLKGEETIWEIEHLNDNGTVWIQKMTEEQFRKHVGEEQYAILKGMQQKMQENKSNKFYLMDEDGATKLIPPHTKELMDEVWPTEEDNKLFAKPIPSWALIIQIIGVLILGYIVLRSFIIP